MRGAGQAVLDTRDRGSAVVVRVLQRNRANGMHIYTEISFKKSAHVIIEVGKSKI